MAKIGRNAACPCGSGKKFKKCCRNREQVHKPAAAGWTIPDHDMDELDRLSNSVIDLLEAKRYDDAEARAREVMRRFPNSPDGLERLADVYTDRGEHEAAHETYRKLARALPSLNSFTPDDEYRTWLTERIRETAPDA